MTLLSTELFDHSEKRFRQQDLSYAGMLQDGRETIVVDEIYYLIAAKGQVMLVGGLPRNDEDNPDIQSHSHVLDGSTQMLRF